MVTCKMMLYDSIMSFGVAARVLSAYFKQPKQT